MTPLGRLAVTAETHLNDLQADIEAGTRHLDRIHDHGMKIWDALVKSEVGQATVMAALVKRVSELRACVVQQRKTMRELRHDIRQIREFDAHK